MEKQCRDLLTWPCDMHKYSILPVCRREILRTLSGDFRTLFERSGTVSSAAIGFLRSRLSVACLNVFVVINLHIKSQKQLCSACERFSSFSGTQNRELMPHFIFVQTLVTFLFSPSQSSIMFTMHLPSYWYPYLQFSFFHVKMHAFLSLAQHLKLCIVFEMGCETKSDTPYSVSFFPDASRLEVASVLFLNISTPLTGLYLLIVIFIVAKKKEMCLCCFLIQQQKETLK